MGLLVCVAQELGLPWTDVDGYSLRPDGHTLLASLNSVLTPVNIPGSPGQIIAFEEIGPAWPQHAGIITDYADGGLGLIHTWATLGKVQEHPLTDEMMSHCVGVWKWPHSY